MSLPIRVVGNKARANPRQYSTQAEPAFAHRKAPPMPSFDHLLQPGRDFVSFLSHRIHSMLGPAFMAYTAPEMATATAPRPVMIETEAPTAYETALLLVNEKSKEWSWNEAEQEKEESDSFPLKLWSMKLPSLQTVRSLVSPTVSNNVYAPISSAAASYALMDISTHQWENERQAQRQETATPMPLLRYSPPRMRLIVAQAEHIKGAVAPQFVEDTSFAENMQAFIKSATTATIAVAYATVVVGTLLQNGSL